MLGARGEEVGDAAFAAPVEDFEAAAAGGVVFVGRGVGVRGGLVVEKGLGGGHFVVGGGHCVGE